MKEVTEFQVISQAQGISSVDSMRAPGLIIVAVCPHCGRANPRDLGRTHSLFQPSFGPFSRNFLTAPCNDCGTVFAIVFSLELTIKPFVQKGT